jgi:tRNA threonylcarbamoyladenosine biosynthesis protein TsaB
MIVLALDTSSKSCSVGLCNSEQLISEITINRRQTHSIHLLDAIHDALRSAGLAMSAIDLISAVIGPGSFTGLRIGLSCIKGLALAAEKPIVGICGLEALASQAFSWEKPICTMVDARKREVYAGCFQREDNTLKTITAECVTPPDIFIERLTTPHVFIGDGAYLYRELIETKFESLARFAASSQNIIRASTVARLGINRFLAKGSDHLSNLVPKYIRKSDAEYKKQ